MSNEAGYYSPGAVVEETAAAAITAGQMEQKCSKAAFAVNDFASGAVAGYQIEGEVKGLFTAVAIAANAGDPVWFDASAGTFTITPCSATGDFFAGILSRAMAASATVGYVLLNEVNHNIPVHKWANLPWEATAADKTLDAQDVGKVFIVTADAKTITLPATVAGLRYIICCTVADDGALMSISPNANDKIMGADVAGTDNKDQQLTKATQNRWDYMELVGDGADGWFIVDKRGTWVEEA